MSDTEDTMNVTVTMTKDEWSRVYRRLIGEYNIAEWCWTGVGPITRTIGEAGGVLEEE